MNYYFLPFGIGRFEFRVEFIPFSGNNLRARDVLVRKVLRFGSNPARRYQFFGCYHYSAEKWLLLAVYRIYEDDYVAISEADFHVPGEVSNGLIVIVPAVSSFELGQYECDFLPEPALLNPATSGFAQRLLLSTRLKDSQVGYRAAYAHEYPISLASLNTTASNCTFSNVMAFSRVEKDTSVSLLFVNITISPNLKCGVLRSSSPSFGDREIGVNSIHYQELSNDFDLSSLEFFCSSLPGIPIFITVRAGNVSVEHTHPPTEHFLGANRYRLARIIKERIQNVIC